MRRRFAGRRRSRARRPSDRARVWLALPAALLFLAGCSPNQARHERPLDPALHEFVRRAGGYAALHRRIEAEGASLEPTDDPAELAVRKDRLARRIHEARTGAKPGDVFTAAAAEPLRRLVRSHERSSLEPKPPPAERPDERPRVNTRYPESEPLPTMPPALLAALPEVPEELQYRLIGPDLALLDSEARIVVDVLPNVRP